MRHTGTGNTEAARRNGRATPISSHAHVPQGMLQCIFSQWVVVAQNRAAVGTSTMQVSGPNPSAVSQLADSAPNGASASSAIRTVYDPTGKIQVTGRFLRRGAIRPLVSVRVWRFIGGPG